MAGIDKIYGTKAQWKQLTDWIKANAREHLKYMYPKPDVDGPLCNFPKEFDMWLLKNCPLEFVLDAIHKQYGMDDG